MTARLIMLVFPLDHQGCYAESARHIGRAKWLPGPILSVSSNTFSQGGFPQCLLREIG